MRKLFSLFIVFLGFTSLVQAEVFAANGGSITATKQGNDVLVTVEGFAAAKLVHFRGQGDKDGFIHPVAMQNGKAVLENVPKFGGRFQVMDATGKWLLITPTGNPYKMVNVVQECKKSKGGCALETKF